MTTNNTEIRNTGLSDDVREFIAVLPFGEVVVGAVQHITLSADWPFRIVKAKVFINAGTAAVRVLIDDVRETVFEAADQLSTVTVEGWLEASNGQVSRFTPISSDAQNYTADILENMKVEIMDKNSAATGLVVELLLRKTQEDP